MSGIIKPPVGAQLKRDHPLARGLVGAWLFNEGGGNKIHESTSWRDGSAVTALAWVPDGISITSNGSCVLCTPNGFPTIGTGDYTVFAKLEKPNAGGNYDTVFYIAPNAGGPIWMLPADMYLNIYDDSAKTKSTTQVPLSTPCFVSWVRRGTGANQTYYYINGKPAGTCTHGESILACTVGIYLGGDGEAAEFYTGKIYCIYFYNRALSAEEVAWLHAFPYAMFEEESPYWILKAAGGATYNESITVSSSPALSNSPKVDFFPSLGAFASTPALNRAVSADLLGGVTMLSTPAASMIGGMDYAAAVTFLSNPAVSMAYLLDIFPSLILSSDPALATFAIADFYNSLTLASTPAAVMAAVADLFVSLVLASSPAWSAVGGSDFYESLGFSSSPALSNAVFKEAFGELSLLSSPALSVSVLADLYAAITMATSAGISMTALADLFSGFSLSSIPALSALGQIGGTIIQKMIMESIGLGEKTLRSEVERLTGDIDIVNRILTNPWDDIAKESTTWEATKKIQKDGE